METNEASDAKNIERLWIPLCTVLVIAGVSSACTSIWGRNSNITLIAAAAAGAIAAVISYFLRNTKKKRIASLVICVCIFALSIGTGVFLSSDSWLVKKEWPSHNIGHITFSYPSQFKQHKTKEDLLANGTVSIYSNDNMNRLVTYIVYDFTDVHPELSDSLAGAVLSLLQTSHATFLSWSDDPDIKPNKVQTRFTYKYRGKPYTGTAFAYSEGDHYELLMFIPLQKQFSGEMLKRIESEIYTDATLID